MNLTGGRSGNQDGGRAARLWPLLWVVWLPALIAPVAALLHAHPAPLRLGAALAGLALFVAIYLWAAWQNDATRAAPAATAPMPWRWRWGPGIALTVLSIAFVLGDGPRWLALFIFSCACVAARLPLGLALRAVATLMLLIVVLGLLTHDPWSDLALAPFWAGITGVFVILLNGLLQTNRALRVAREENARLAVEAERLRFARDLHDLLGHDLARIALQSEVGEALIPTAPERAVGTLRDIGDTARTALQEVRAAVAGYRQPTLASELRGAEAILSAAGIAYRHEGERLAAPAAVEAVLAWAVREGVTNVVKHSRAQRCTIRTTQGVGLVGVEVNDDGRGAHAPDAGGPSLARGSAGSPPPAPGAHASGASGPALAAGSDGNGLPGLAERVAAFGGHCEAGPRTDGGYRLAVTLPLTPDAGDGARLDRAPEVVTGAGGSR